MFLNSPATYLSLADFRSQANDYDISGYTDAEMTDILERASGAADSIMRKSYQPQEVTEYFEGNGTNLLMFCRSPLIYVKNVQFVMPGFAPFSLPLAQLLIDYERGSIRSYSPMIFQGLGVANFFPRGGLPIIAQYAYGLGYPIPSPSFSLSDAPADGNLTPGTAYDFTVSSRTQWGESLESSVQSFTPAGNAIAVNITPQPGALVSRVYAAVHGQQRILVGESPATNYGQSTVTVTVTGISPPSNYGTLYPPTSDTSAKPIPKAMSEAVRLITLGMLWEQNNMANRGVYLEESGRKRISWKSTEGMSGRGVPLYFSQAEALLSPYADSGVY